MSWIFACFYFAKIGLYTSVYVIRQTLREAVEISRILSVLNERSFVEMYRLHEKERSHFLCLTFV